MVVHEQMKVETAGGLHRNMFSGDPNGYGSKKDKKHPGLVKRMTN